MFDERPHPLIDTVADLCANELHRRAQQRSSAAWIVMAVTSAIDSPLERQDKPRVSTIILDRHINSNERTTACAAIGPARSSTSR
jgi:hypothetical protein